MRITSLCTGIALAVLANVPFAMAQSADPLNRQFDYFLPRTSVGAVVTQRITACPEWNEDKRQLEGFTLVTAIATGSETRADPAARYTVDARAGFLSSRSTKLTLRPDGTLESFNVESKGQGGAVLKSAVMAAATLATWGTPAMAAPALVGANGALKGGMVRYSAPITLPLRADAMAPFRCKPAVAAAIARLDAVKRDIADLEAQIGADGPSGAHVVLLEQRRAEVVALTARLTLQAGTGAEFDPDRAELIPGADGKPIELAEDLPAPQFESWFQYWDPQLKDYVDAAAQHRVDLIGRLSASSPCLIPGGNGFRVTLAADQAMLAAMAGQPKPKVGTAQRFVYYRRPVPARLAVEQAEAPGLPEVCKSHAYAPANTRASQWFGIPQLSGDYSISIGSGGLFGTRQLMVKLSPSGAPIALEYGSEPGAADMAAAIDGAVAGGETYRDRQLAETKREIELITAERSLRDLLEAE